MSEQNSPSGIDSAPAPRSTDCHRLFFAILPDLGTAARIEQLARQLRIEHALTGKMLRTEHFHVTLHFIGTYSGFFRQVAEGALAAAATMLTPAFDVVFDRAGSFHRKRGDRPFVLLGGESAGLKELHEALGAALEKAGLKCHPTSGFTPHLTLLYDKHAVDERDIEPVRWAVNSEAFPTNEGERRHSYWSSTACGSGAANTFAGAWVLSRPCKIQFA
jgi:RNA 2',3'-cyclic 3'-phosphodiesterase